MEQFVVVPYKPKFCKDSFNRKPRQSKVRSQIGWGIIVRVSLPQMETWRMLFYWSNLGFLFKKTRALNIAQPSLFVQLYDLSRIDVSSSYFREYFHGLMVRVNHPCMHFMFSQDFQQVY